MPGSAAPRLERAEVVERLLFLRTLFAAFLPPEIARARATSAAATATADRMIEAFHMAGTTIYQAGDAARAVYFIAEGDVELQDPREAPWAFRSGDAIGFLDVMQDQPHERTAIARSDVRLLAVAADDWLDVLEDNFEFLRGSIVSMSARLQALALRLAPGGGFAEPSPEVVAAAGGAEWNNVERLIAMRQVAAFRSVPVDPLLRLARGAEDLRLAEGDVLFREGEPTTELYSVVSGRIDIACGSPALFAAFVPGTVVGGFTALGPTTRVFTATATRAAHVLRIRLEDYFDLMEDHFEVARAVLAEISRERARLMKLLAQRG